ncbi:hypothetical protein ACFP81_11015 [Deinococcus lacus]|uniref:Uncharacterized protein n=1 Tax=Deinococcus lacus TaxID=392561 RepID=A0ABW1YDQ4_9DEIO
MEHEKDKGLVGNIVDTLRSGVEELRQKGEELTQSARLRMDIAQRHRELETLYTRLGRAYHSGTAPEVLEVIQQEIREVDRDIAAREKQLSNLGEDEHTGAVRLDEIRIQQVLPVQEMSGQQVVSDGAHAVTLPSDTQPLTSGDTATFVTRSSANVEVRPGTPAEEDR